MKAVFQKTDDFGFIAKRIKNFRGYPPMFHSHLELIYVISGEISMNIDGHSRRLKEGEMSVLFPYIVHSYENAPETEIYIMLFEPQIVGSFEEELGSQKPAFPFYADARPLEPLFERIVELASSGDSVGFKTACSYLQAAVGELLAVMPLCEIDAVAENMTKPILLYCSEHFSDGDISIKKVADELYISKSYVSKVFSSKLKYGFREYVNELRISEAKKLLKKTDRKIVDIMLDCGFKNQSSFNRIFSDICGISPKEYRQKRKQEQLKAES